MTVSLSQIWCAFACMLTIAARVDDPTNRSMPDLNRSGRDSYLLPAPEVAVTLKEYEIEELPV